MRNFDHHSDHSRDVAGHVLNVPEAAREMRKGHMLLIYDDRSREAALCLAAQFAQPEAVSFLQDAARDRIAVVLSGSRLEQLHLTLPQPATGQHWNAAPTVSVDVRTGLVNGFTMHDDAATIRALVDPTTRPDDLRQPGHIFLLRSQPGGTLTQRGFPEAGCDLMCIAGLEPGAVLCNVAPTETDAFDQRSLRDLARKWQIGILSIDTLVRYRREQRVSLVTETLLPTAEATFRLYHFQEIATGEPYLALVLGDISGSAEHAPLVRLHSACTTGDIFGSQRCDCQAQMHSALHQIAQEGRGIFLYLPQEGRGIGLAAKLQAYVLQEQGYDTLEANERLGYPVDARSYDCAGEILSNLGISRARLLTNNPDKIEALREAGIAVEPVPLVTPPTPANLRYLRTKQQRLGHLFSLPG